MTEKAAKAEPAKQRKRRPMQELMEQIVAAAAAEFKKNGYAGATTAAIARNADVTEAQIFRYFNSKSDLFRSAIFDPLDQQLLAFADEHHWNPDNRGEGAHLRSDQFAYVDTLKKFLEENIEYIVSLSYNNFFNSDGSDKSASVTSLQKYFERGASILTEYYKSGSQVDPKLMVRVSFAAVLGCVMFKDWIFPEGLADDEAISQAIKDFVTDGVNGSGR